MAPSTPQRASVRLTPNFENNLGQIEAYWGDNQFAAGFDRLVAELLETVIPTLQDHPRLGRPFFDRHPQTLRAQQKMRAVTAQLAKLAPDAELREYVMTDYTALYALASNSIYLLAIKHHKQLVFDVGQ